MGSATREALGAATAVLDAQSGIDLATGEQLLAASLVVDGSTSLRAALSDDTAAVADRKSIVDAVFGGYTKSARSVLESLSSQRWSSEDEFVEGIERMGIRAIAASAPKTVSVDDELFTFSNAVMSDPELELALGNRLGASEGKVALVNRLLKGKASEQTIAILGALLTQPRGRRIGELVRYAAGIVANQAGHEIATVTVAAPLTAAQNERLVKALTKQYGSTVRINVLVDPSIMGGMRVQVGDDVIDGTIASRITDLRLQLVSN